MDTAALNEARRAYRDATRAAEDRGRTFLGGQSAGVVRMAEYDSEARYIYVLGQSFSLAGRDSARVIMVDERADGQQVLVGSAWVGSTLPEEAWDRHWVSGDTTFVVRAGSRAVHLLDVLRRSPEVREFISARSETAAGEEGS
jgi:hypothetical protein